jgi:hypothetical protein
MADEKGQSNGLIEILVPYSSNRRRLGAARRHTSMTSSSI